MINKSVESKRKILRESCTEHFGTLQKEKSQIWLEKLRQKAVENYAKTDIKVF